MTHRSYKTESRVDWGTSSDGLLNIEQINCGAILRIADAVEKMAASYDQMRNARACAVGHAGGDHAAVAAADDRVQRVDAEQIQHVAQRVRLVLGRDERERRAAPARGVGSV